MPDTKEPYNVEMKEFSFMAICNSCGQAFTFKGLGPNENEAKGNGVYKIVLTHGWGQDNTPICPKGKGKNANDYTIS